MSATTAETAGEIVQVGLGFTLDGLSLGYGGGLVLRDVDLEVRPGEVLVIVGASGSGKSTLLRALAGLLRPYDGKIVAGDAASTGHGDAGHRDADHRDADHRDAHHRDAHHRDAHHRAMVFQDDALLPWRSVRRNVELPLRLRGVPRRERRPAADRWLARVGLAGFEERLPRELSGGMRQRVQLARALVAAPRAVLMDEPFGALDAQTRAGMQRLLLDVLRDTRATVVFVTHDVDEALLLADRVVVLGRGGVRSLIDVPTPREPAADRGALRARILEEL
ncbi:ATP-binding cassette domain-containing protein [Nonomuraea sp. 3-1Str]|uniref:ABC transporter ATP-binding protein n=1 Tax=Nonomuraea sp. 3-1Str TaxID=2929801 RepID=UPI0028651E3C|nr:ATP-binding cassette domain-containing protein [Nonomuraea sp. 3-1Str]MDR8408190.1 ATP-binding cassette domain-containing protein [Nonomuraea sp. 3-1Str]